MRTLFMALFVSVLWSACSIHQQEASNDYTRFVNPFLGTGGKGHTYPGASVPFGMVQISPDNSMSGWDRISGYYYPDTVIAGFSQTHLSGTGIGDMYDIPFMPVTWPYNKERNSTFSHDNEQAEPGYYRVLLKDYDIEVELTATKRCGFHKYTFPKADTASVFIDLNRALNWDYTLDTKIEVVSNNEIRGYRYSKGWADAQQLFFVAQFSKPFINAQIDTLGCKKPFKEDWGGTGYIARFDYTPSAGEELLVKIGISPVSIEGAVNNLDTEIPGWDFDETRQAAKTAWNKELAKIDIETDNAGTRTIFYTTLYQSMLAPTLFMDGDGKYYGPDGKIHTTDGWDNYSTFSLWDTFRAAHPLYTIMHPERVNDMVKSMLAFYKQNGHLPVWPLAGCETNCMIGYHAVPVIADAYLKGMGDFDPQLALEACVASAKSDFRGIKQYEKHGYVPYNHDNESVSKTLEYAYDDWCIAMMAKKMGETAIYNEFIKRAANFRNVYNPTSRFMHPRDDRGNWIERFVGKHYTEHFTESNAWHYFFFVPQDIEGLIQLTGGNKPFIAKLDSMFTYAPEADDELPIFSTGMIGQYVHGNEPSHHVGYLYNYAGAPWKTQEIVHQIATTQYANTPEGHCGNEDCGQLSAWYIFSAMGFYPVNPADQTYVFGSPLVKKASIQLANGNRFVMQAHDLSNKNIYIHKVLLNGKPFDKTFITHEQINSGAKLEFFMSDTPNKAWGTDHSASPPSMTK